MRFKHDEVIKFKMYITYLKDFFNSSAYKLCLDYTIYSFWGYNAEIRWIENDDRAVDFVNEIVVEITEL